MLRLLLVLALSTSACSESVRETETWMPMKTTQAVAMSPHSDGLESSGDFGFTDDEDEEEDIDDDDYYPSYDDEDDYDESSGSGDGETTVSPDPASQPPVKPDDNDNKIPDEEPPVRPTVNDVDIIQNSNGIPLAKKGPETGGDYPSNVLMAHASEDSILNKTEVLAALIVGCAVGLMFAVLLVLLLIYRMKKKDEGSYDLGKKPIYKKAPTTEIYA